MRTDLIERYLADDCTVEEAAQVLRWFSTDEGQLYLQNRLDTELASTNQLPHESLEKEAFWMRLRQAIAPPVLKPLRRSFGAWQWLAAASVALLLLAGGYYYYTLEQWQTVATTFGQTQTLTLPDQSVVMLNGNSEIKYRRNWSNETPREVWIKGEAFFKVTHLSNQKRFFVHLPQQYNVEVLGTEFNVYARQQKTRVVLNTGKIKLTVSEKADNALMMKPGDMFEADDVRQHYATRRVNAETYSCWRKSVLTFENASLAEIVEMLEETYGLEVTVEDKLLLTQRFSGTIPTQNADLLLDGLSQLFDLNIVKTNNKVSIKSNS
jgi:transmembrane sensor